MSKRSTYSLTSLSSVKSMTVRLLYPSTSRHDFRAIDRKLDGFFPRIRPDDLFTGLTLEFFIVVKLRFLRLDNKFTVCDKNTYFNCKITNKMFVNNSYQT